jgi:hypothetical protein
VRVGVRRGGARLFPDLIPVRVWEQISALIHRVGGL